MFRRSMRSRMSIMIHDPRSKLAQVRHLFFPLLPSTYVPSWTILTKLSLPRIPRASGDCHYRQVGRTRPGKLSWSFGGQHDRFARHIRRINDVYSQTWRRCIGEEEGVAARRKLPRMLTRCSRLPIMTHCRLRDAVRRFSEKIVVANWAKRSLWSPRERSSKSPMTHLAIAHTVNTASLPRGKFCRRRRSFLRRSFKVWL